MTKKNIIISSAVVLLIAAIAGIKVYSHHCQQILREVDRYAIPQVIEFMEALEDWNLETLKPFLTEQYINSLTTDEWKSELEKLSVLGALQSFARPGFVSHTPYKKYKICESAVEMYSVTSEFEKDNAVVRIFFDNNCGNLKVASFIVTSPSIKISPDYLENIPTDGDDTNEIIGDILDESSDSEAEVDLDELYEHKQEDAPLPELDEETIKEVEKKLDETKKKSQGKVYRY